MLYLLLSIVCFDILWVVAACRIRNCKSATRGSKIMVNGGCFFNQVERYLRKHKCCLLAGAYLCFAIHMAMEKLKDKCWSFCHSRGCLGCCMKPLMISVEKPSNGLKFQGGRVTEDFWSSSTYEMDSAAPSQRSASSISIPIQALDALSNNPSEFVNQGLLLWNQTRQRWVGNKGSQHHKKAREPSLSWNATYESLLGTNKPFPKPIPLSEMVDFLLDVWEQEGLYD